MHYNWYKEANIQQEAGLLSDALKLAVLAVLGGAAIWWAAQQFNVSEDDIQNEIQNREQKASTNTAILTQELLDAFKRLEGTRRYQAYKGYYKDGKFYPYTDSEGHLTVGYGHKVLPGEDFSNGVDDQEADGMLQMDAVTAIRGANSLLENTPVTTEAAQIIANMAFQMGADGVAGFSNMWQALSNQDYDTAADEMLKSKWNTQTPSRAKELSDVMRIQ
jgi:GH24 family phage-related lysozyme (muramidase)